MHGSCGLEGLNSFLLVFSSCFGVNLHVADDRYKLFNNKKHGIKPNIPFDFHAQKLFIKKQKNMSTVYYQSPISE